MDNSPPGSSIHGIFQGRILDQSVSSVTQSCPTLWDPVDCRLPCPSPAPGAYSDSCPSSHWCHPTISSSVVPFSSRLQSFPALGSFLVSQFFISGGHRISFSISPSNEYSGLISLSLRRDWLDLLEVQGTLKSLLQHHSSKSINSSVLSFLYSPTLTSIHDHWKTWIALTRRTFVGKVMSLLFNMLSRLIIVFLPRSKRLLISWL